MSIKGFEPTDEQKRVIQHSGSAFVTACPGAGKTRVMVERARQILKLRHDGRGVAFLSFTRAAVSELEARLIREGVIRSPAFPNFIGTFDSFVWQFFVAPFGIPGTTAPPRLVPDLYERQVIPFERAQALSLSCFDRVACTIDATAASRFGFWVQNKKPSVIRAYESLARRMFTRFRDRGELSFDDARDIALARLRDAELSPRLALALSARFSEIVVDEAQDCSPEDLEIVNWLRASDIHTKIVCDPHQSIYQFRGGVTDELLRFEDTFAASDQLHMTGNFRSSPNICKAIVMLRPKAHRTPIDEPLGKFKCEKEPIYLLAYNGPSVPPTVGQKYSELLAERGIDVRRAPVLAATRNSGANAVGQLSATREDLTFRLAKAVSDFFAVDSTKQTAAIEEMHRIILTLEGRLVGKTYHQFLAANEMKPEYWRPQVLSILHDLRYDPALDADANAWLERARRRLAPFIPEGSPSIARLLRKNQDVDSIVRMADAADHPPARTIHSVKGMEFPSVCVVTVQATLPGILDYLETGEPEKRAEDARKLYVAASRAERLLVFAVPKSQSDRLAKHLRMGGCEVTILNV